MRNAVRYAARCEGREPARPVCSRFFWRGEYSTLFWRLSRRFMATMLLRRLIPRETVLAQLVHAGKSKMKSAAMRHSLSNRARTL